MAKRDILRTAKSIGLKITDIEWSPVPTPGEMVPCWSIYFDFDDADLFGINGFHQFDNTAHAVDWMKRLKKSSPSAGEKHGT